MKKFIVLALAAITILNVYAQKGANEYKKRPSLGIQFFLNDFKTAAEIKASSLSTVLKANQWYKVARMLPGLAFTYTEGITNNIDYNVRAAFSFIRYPFRNRPTPSNNKLLTELDASLHFKLVKDNHFIAPFISAGLAASSYDGYFGAVMPVGLGLQFNFDDQAYAFLHAQHRIAVMDNTSSHLFYAIGFATPITEKKKPEPVVVPVPVVEPPKDTDGDGIIDSLDACPTVKGISKFNGCPDTDNDGIQDSEDKCPTVPGLAKYSGCPIPDTDNDGINDEQDKCPAVPGVARYDGCPIPDTDKDGVNDEEDKCPSVPGPASNFGCPEISKEIINKVNVAAKNIYFNTGSAVLKAQSNKSLNTVVKILKDNPELRVSIEGHTDNTGKADKNQVLSENRAKAVLTYLTKKGIDATRLSSAGYGQDKPVADNRTAKGRTLNRRVELKLRNYQ